MLQEKADEEIILSYKNGIEEVLKELINRYTPSIYNFVARLADKSNAADITQEIFIKVWKNIKYFDSSRASFKTWIFTIAKNTTTDFLRKKRLFLFSDIENDDNENTNSMEENIPDDNLLPDEALQKLEDKEFLEKILKKLRPSYQEVLVLHYQEEMTFEEIAKILNKPANTVKSHHRRALLELRKIISASPSQGEDLK